MSRLRLTRRTALKAAALAPLIGCTSEEGRSLDAGDAGATAADATAADASSPDAIADAAAEDAAAEDAAAPDAEAPDTGPPDSGTTGQWATGGTASMSGNYPDPFAGGIGNACALTCSATLGPCYVQTIDRKDISEGEDGLPVRFAFLIVDESCNPIEGATLDIWHTNAGGFYSGNEAPALCTLNDARARAARWHRGVQTTNASGRVDFDTCFPGWYGGRTIHIHFTVRVNGNEYVTSQLYFEDGLCDEIVASQPIYSDRGARDTDNNSDGIFPRNRSADYVFQTARQADGAMLAWKAIVIRSSLGDPGC